MTAWTHEPYRSGAAAGSIIIGIQTLDPAAAQRKTPALARRGSRDEIKDLSSD